MARIVIDANVIVSAAFGGFPLDAVSAAFSLHEVIVSEQVERELLGVVDKMNLKLSAELGALVCKKVCELLALATRVAVTEHVAICRDAKDDHYLSLCKAGQADFLVTGDKDLLSIPRVKLKQNGIVCLIVSPRRFLEAVEPEQAG